MMSSPNHRDDLMHDLQAVIRDAESILKGSSFTSDAEFISAKERFESTLKNAKDEIIRLEKLVVGKTKEAATVTDNYVKDNPWQAVGLGAAVGIVIGLLVARR